MMPGVHLIDSRRAGSSRHPCPAGVGCSWRGIARILCHRVPVPLVQIGLGAFLGFATDLRLRIEPEMFLLLFLPPVLFLDALRIPKAALRPTCELSANLR